MGLTNFLVLKYKLDIMSYLLIFMCFLIAFALSSMFIPRILLVAYRKRLFDIPDERKVHEKEVPRLGGISFLPSILFSLCFITGIRYQLGYPIPAGTLNFLIPEFYLLICGLILLYLVGIKDDLVGVYSRSKLMVQIAAACLLPLSGLWINNLYGLLGIHELTPWVGIPLTILGIVFIVNAINLIDGIDGLASGLSSIPLVVFSFLFFSNDFWTYSMLAFATLGVLVPFFYYNVFGNAEHCRKIFMGDTGSLTLGFLLAFLAIRYAVYRPSEYPSSECALMIAVSTLIIPLFDVFRVIFLRFRTRRPIFEADKNHIHHKLLAIGFTPRQVLLCTLLAGYVFCGVNIALSSYVNCNLLLLGDILIYTVVNLWLDWLRNKKRKN